MSASAPFEIFLVAIPGLEAALRDEAVERGFADARLVDGGVALTGGWPDVWRANLELRGPTRVLVRTTDEEGMIARHVLNLLRRSK